MRKILFLLLAPVLLASCSDEAQDENREPVAKVFDQYLYQEDIQGIMSEGISPSDSATKAQNFIDNWVKTQLMIKKAELNLREDEKDVQKQLEEYRNSLIIYKYKQKYLEQKLDTVVTEQQIEEYYHYNSANFLLNKNVAKALFIKVPSDIPNIAQIRYLYKSERPRDIERLKQISTENALVFDDFGGDWVGFTELLKLIPASIENQKEFLNSKRFIETQDTAFHYFVNIKEYKLTNDIAPLKFVRDNIKSVLLNKRRTELLNEMENSIYRSALNRNDVEFYK